MAERNAKKFRKSFALSALKKGDGKLVDGLTQSKPRNSQKYFQNSLTKRKFLKNWP